jgi:hypothetical protein
MKQASNVPSEPVVWRATLKDSTGGERTHLIKARLWFDARAEAALKFKCDPGDLNVERL